MGHGPAGGRGLPVSQGGRAGQECAIILHLKGAELPAWALSLRTSSAKHKFYKLKKVCITKTEINTYSAYFVSS